MSNIKKVGINGFGRIGRLVFRALLESKEMNVVAINDVVDSSVLLHLLKYDSAHGPLKGWEATVSGDDILHLVCKKTKIIKNIKIYNFFSEKAYKWAEQEVDCVVDCSGRNLDRESIQAHIDAGAGKVVISAPAKGDIPTIVYSVNHTSIKNNETVISAASCTTNALAPIVKVVHETFGIKSGFMTTIHAYTSDQRIQDAPHADLRRSRAAMASIIPTTTGAAVAIGKVIPSLLGKLDGIAHRVPVLTGSLVDFTVTLENPATAEKINSAIKAAASPSLCYTEDPIVSADVVSHTAGSIFDSLLTKVLPTGQVKLYMWYDNEASYVNQLVRTLGYFIKL